MYPIIPTLKANDASPAVANLQTGVLALVEHQVIKALDPPNHPTGTELKALLLAVKDEQTRQTFGPGTVQLVRFFQIQQGNDSLNGVVEVWTATKLNEQLRAIGVLDVAPSNSVSGAVLNANRTPAVGILVRAVDRDLRSEQTLGQATTDATGRYVISYTSDQFASGEQGTADLIVRALDSQGTQLAASSILFNAPSQATVDLVLPDTRPQLSEYERYLATIAPLLEGQGVTLADLNTADIDFIVGDTGINRQHVAWLALAAARSAAITAAPPGPSSSVPPATALVPIDFFYGWFREGLPTDVAALAALPRSSFDNATRAAVAANIVPAGILDNLSSVLDHWDAYRGAQSLSGAIPTIGISGTQLLDSLSASISAAGRARLTQIAGANGGLNGPAIQAASADPALKGSKDLTVFLRGLSFATIAESHAPLVVALDKVASARTDIASARDLVRLGDADWLAIATSSGVPGISSPTDAQIQDYANTLRLRVESQYLSDAAAYRISTGEIPLSPDVSDGVKTLMAADSRITLGSSQGPPLIVLQQTTSVQGITNLPQVKDEVLAVDRIVRLAGNTSDAGDLLRAGYRSATDIVNAGYSAFLASMTSGAAPGSSQWPADKTGRTFAQAQTIEQAATLLLAGHLVNAKRPPVYVLDPAPAPASTDSQPTLSDFLGGSAACACEECSSVLSPSAYLADILAYLERNQLLDALLAQRPDLEEIVLDCANAETEIPYVDLVVEILERAVVQPPLQIQPKLVLTELGSTDVTQLNQGQVSLGLRLALAEAGIDLTASTVVQTGKPGTWYVRDRGWTLQLAQNRSAFSVSPWPQTGADSEAERAWPEHQFPNPYQQLANAVYPWTLPFDLALEQWRSALPAVGLTREMLLQLFSAGTQDARNAIAALERLKLTAKEFVDLDSTTSLNGAQIAQLWGFADINVTADDPNPVYDGSTTRPKLSGWMTISARASFFLARTTLTFAEMQELLESRFVTGPTPFALASVDGNDPYTCDPRKLNISGLTGQNTSLLEQRFLAVYRFVRLARATQLRFGELDILLNAVQAADWKTTLINISNALEVKGQLHLTTQETAAFWADLDAHGFNDYTGGMLTRVSSLYEKAFRSKPDTAAVFPEDAGQLGTSTFATMAAPLSACLVFDQSSLAQWLQISGVIPENSTDLSTAITLSNLSRLYRHLTLAESLNLSADDYHTAVALLGDPFSSPATTQSFLDRFSSIRKSALSLETLDYLLRYNTRSHSAGRDATLASALETLRHDLADFWVPPVPSGGKIDGNIDALVQSVSRSTGAGQALLRDLLTSYLHAPVDRTATTHRTLATFSLDHASWPADDTIPISRASAGALMSAFELLTMALELLQSLQGTQSALSWIFPYAGAGQWLNPDALPVSATDPGIPAPQYERLAAWTRYDRTLFAGNPDLTSLFSTLSDSTKPKSIVISQLCQALPLDPVELTPLIGQADNDSGLWAVSFRADYWDPALIERLRIGALAAQRLGVSMRAAANWAGQAASAAFNARLKVADLIEQTVRSVIGTTQWERVAAHNDLSLREKRRQALVAFLLQRDSLPDSSALYGQYLIDVEMSPCQITTRVAQAIFSAQLFVQRVQLNLIPGVAFPATADGAEAVNEWNTWRKWYRVWQANREVFLYPENWLQPELRDDKSQIFREFETELLQSDLTSDSATQAFGNYLETFGQITRLQVVSILDTVANDTTVTHIVARTRFGPATYYYRTRMKRSLSSSLLDFVLLWTAWEKIDTDISGDFVIPVVYGKRVDLVWPIISEKLQDGATGSGTPAKDWEVQFARTRRTPSGWKVKETIGKSFRQPQLPAKSASESFVFRTVTESDKTRILCFAGQEVPAVVNWSLSSVTKATSGSIPSVIVNVSCFYQGHPTWGVPGLTVTLGLEVQLVGTLVFVPLATSATGLTSSNGVASLTVPIAKFGTPAAPLSNVQVKVTMPGDNPGVVKSVNWNPPPGDPIIRGSGTPLLYSLTLDPANWLYSLVLETDLSAPQTAPDPNRPLAWSQIAELQYESSGHAELNPFLSNLSISSPAQSFPTGMGYESQRLPAATGVFLSYSPNPSPVLVSSDAGVDVIGSTERTGVSGELFVKPFYSSDIDADFFQPFAVNSTRGSYLADSSQTFLFLGGSLTKVELHPLHYPRDGWILSLSNDDELEKLAEPDLNPGGNSQDLDLTLSPASGSQVTATFDPEGIEFDYSHANAIYNWEVFFHIPFLIAVRLNQNQRFAEAQQWFHRIFNPISPVNGSAGVERFWRLRPFRDLAAKPPTLADLLADGNALSQQVAEWEAQPFNPHMLARSRPVSYMITVVTRYIQNLVDWGDQLFRRETLEAINEATQYYVLASQLLGPRPQQAYRRGTGQAASFDHLSDFDALSNPIAVLSGVVNSSAAGGLGSSVPRLDLRYFCIPPNDQLAGYWDLVEDRLFKVRHCLNLQGGALQTSLFGPPIDPGLLVQAVAAGLDLSTILDNSADGSHPYRFTVLIQKANELCAEVKGLGSALLSAVEKQDGEDLALLRAGHEKALLTLVKDVRQKQLDEANASLIALRASRAVAMERLTNYRRLLGEDALPLPAEGNSVQRVTSTLQKGITSVPIPLVPALVGIGNAAIPVPGSSLGLSLLEQAQLLSSGVATGLTIGAGVVRIASSVSHALPNEIAGTTVPAAVQTESGGSHIGFALDAVAAGLDSTAHTAEQVAGMLSVLGGHERRRDDWAMQHNLAAADIEQIDKQIIAAGIRAAIAQNELDNHMKQIEQSGQVEEFLRSKFSNRDLYHWMIAQISGTYFRTYQLSAQLASAAQTAYGRELVPDSPPGFISQGYWNSLKQGLLAGEQLSLDLKRMELSYLEQNRREYELTKSISLFQLDPLALLKLRTDGTCTFTVPEVLFDLDFPGQYLRRIKSVSVTVPCVTGPYGGVTGVLEFSRGFVRSSAPDANTYAQGPTEECFPYTKNISDSNSIATSTGQADAGIFEFNFRDERYLPFEGAGVANSTWTFSLPSTLRAFDYSTIADFVIHIRYTARGSGDGADVVKKQLQSALNKITAGSQTEEGLWRLFSLRTEFSTEWNKLRSRPTDPVTLTIGSNRFPIILRGIPLTVTWLRAAALLSESAPSASVPASLSMAVTATMGSIVSTFALTLQSGSATQILQADQTLQGQPLVVGTADIQLAISFAAGADVSAVEDVLLALRFSIPENA